MSEIKIGVDWSQGDDKTCVVFIRSDGDGTFTVIGELFGEVAEFVAALETANADLLEALERLRLAEKDCMALRNWDKGFEDWADVAELKEAQAEADEAIRKHKGEGK